LPGGKAVALLEAFRPGQHELSLNQLARRTGLRLWEIGYRGGRLPPHCTGVGKVLLAYAPPELLDELLLKGPERFTPLHPDHAPAADRALCEVRRAGLAYQREEMDLGLVSVAALVADAGGAVVASLSVVLRASRHQLRQFAPAVQTATASASRELREHNVRGAGVGGILRMLEDNPSDPLPDNPLP
jgi:DNA-binding IclR family transcriptional regulator